MVAHRFETPAPVRLHVEIDKGSVRVVATGTAETIVEIAGRDAEQVRVQQDGERVSVIGPNRHGGLFGIGLGLDVVITLPTGSLVAARTGSADILVSGSVGEAQLRSGSGDLDLEAATGVAVLETGSGDIRVESAGGDVKATSGSGDVRVRAADGALRISTGSGDVELGSTHGPVEVKTGSGDIRVGDAGGDALLRTASGDFVVDRVRRGRMTVEGASGDAHLGVVSGIPVWTDVSTVTGEIRSSLRGAGQPKDGADHVEIRARLVNGDIVLTEV
jgi:hypothetical protein